MRSVGDKVRGRLIFGDGSIVEGVIIQSDANISRDAVLVKTPDGGIGTMLEQSILDEEITDG